MTRRPPRSPLFPSTTLFRSGTGMRGLAKLLAGQGKKVVGSDQQHELRSEEHTSELQSQFHLVCPLLLLNDPAPPEISPLPLHDALPIWDGHARVGEVAGRAGKKGSGE